MHVVGAAAPAPMQKGLDSGHRQRGDADRIALVARVEQPDELRPVGAVVLDRLIGDHQQVAAKQRQHGVAETVVGRRVRPARDQPRPRAVGNIDHHGAAVEVAEIAAVGALGIDVGVVRAKAGVEFRRQALRRRRIVAFHGARQVPASERQRLRRVAHVDDAVDLVVLRIARLELRVGASHVHRGAVDEPQRMAAPRRRARGVEERDRARLLRHADVEQLEARRLQAEARHLVGDRHQIARGLERIGAHLGMRQIGLHDHSRRARIGDIDRGEVLRRALVREPQDAAPAARELHRHALAHAAKAVQAVLGEEFHVERHVS